MRLPRDLGVRSVALRRPGLIDDGWSTAARAHGGLARFGDARVRSRLSVHYAFWMMIGLASLLGWFLADLAA
jgi:hypothetical protein